MALLAGCATGTAPAPAASDRAASDLGASDPGTDPVRVLVYNIRAGKDMAGEDNLEGVAGVIRDTRADLVLLQEVDRRTARSGGVDQLGELSRLTGFHGVFGKTLDYQGGDYGIALLSRWPIVADTLIPLPVEPAQARAGGYYEPRGALRAVVAAPGGTIGVLNTHLDAGRDDAYRLQEVATLVRAAAALRADHSRVVVGGDFNAEPGTRTIRAMLDAGWADAWERCDGGSAAAAGLTFPADAPVKRIDYLFVSTSLRCANAAVLATTVSDHRPVLVELR